MRHVDWQPWQTKAFLEAQRHRRPVLLLLETAWSPACAHAHVDIFSRADIAAAIAETAIAVRVDADRRPDIGDRYGLGHWPSLLFLTPDGDVLTGGTRLDHSLALRIRDVARIFGGADGRWSAPVATDGGAAPINDELALAGIVEALRVHLTDRPDDLSTPHAPSASAALFALTHATVTADPDWADLAAAAIDRLDAGTRAGRGVLTLVPAAGDWPAVARLEDQAEWTRTLARAVRLEPLPGWIERLEDLVTGLVTFCRPDGHWRPWSGPTRVVLVDASARACRALLAAADALDRPDLARQAIGALEVLAPAAYARAAGVAHLIEDGQSRGPMLLDDAMLLAHALLDGNEWRDDTVYRDLADELVRTTLARLGDSSGALVDRVAALAGAGQVGRLAQPHHPLTGNAEAARLMRRLYPDEPEASAQATRILRAISADAAAAGPFGAPVGLAWHALGSTGSVTAAW